MAPAPLVARLLQGWQTSLQLPIFHQPSLWHGIVLLAWLLVLGLKGLGHWLVLWYGVLGIAAIHHTFIVVPLHQQVTHTPEADQRQLFGQILITQTLISVVFAVLGWGVLHYGLGLTGPLSYSVALLCGSLPFANTLLALATAQNLHHYARWQVATQLTTLLGGIMVISFWVWPLSQTHVAWLLVASHITSTCVGLLGAGFIGFETPNPMPLLAEGLAQAKRSGLAPVATWLLHKGVIIATAVWIGPTTAALLALLDTILSGLLPNVLPNPSENNASPQQPAAGGLANWAAAGISLLIIEIIALIAAPVWIGPGHQWMLLGITLWLAFLSLLRCFGSHVHQQPLALWGVSLMVIFSFYWLYKPLGLITPLCLWTVAWGILHLLPAQHTTLATTAPMQD